MSKELEALEKIQKRIYGEIPETADIVDDDLYIIETTIKNQKRKLDLIGEVLVDVSKGNYSDLSVAIDEIREVFEND